MNSPVIQFEGVSKNYPRYQHITSGLKHFLLKFPREYRGLRSNYYQAFRDISFSVNRGESVGIIGRNGAGKSTVLGLIAGVLKPTSGTVKVSGRISPLLELGAGFHPELTGIENIFLNGILLGMLKKEVAAKVDEIVAFSELDDFIDQPIRVYSTGMMARLGFSVVAHLDPEILLIDEVLAVGDFAFQRKCLNKIHEFKRRGVTIVLVSHALGDVEEICDKAVWIENHVLAGIGSPKTVIAGFIHA